MPDDSSLTHVQPSNSQALQGFILPLDKPKPLGRPSIYSLELEEKICTRIAKGESLRAICRDDGMPDACTVHSWIARIEAFAKHYALAREDQADCYADEITEIADAATPLDVNVARLRVDARKWVASKLKPKKYADRVDTSLEVSVKTYEQQIKELADKS